MSNVEFNNKLVCILQSEIHDLHNLKNIPPEFVNRFTTQSWGKISFYEIERLITHYNQLLIDAQNTLKINVETSLMFNIIARILVILKAAKHYSIENKL